MTTTTTVRFPTDLLYSKSGLWVRIREGIATVGLTPELTQEDDVEFIDLPHLGGVRADDDIGALETMKASITYSSPVTGTIVEVNEVAADDDTDNINNDYYGEGWLFRVKLTSSESLDLLTAAQYEEYLEQEEYENGRY